MSRFAKLFACVLATKTLYAVLIDYRHYFPPDFDAHFLMGRDHYFFGIYRWAFYSHIIAGPFSLTVGLVLISNTFRLHFPLGHRHLGRIQVACILLFVAPSGLWMARYAVEGVIAEAGFAALALATAVCTLVGWRTAAIGAISRHRTWMQRCFLLLFSAVVLRLIGGAAELLRIEWTYAYAAWGSWLFPLAIYEVWRLSPGLLFRRRQW